MPDDQSNGTNRNDTNPFNRPEDDKGFTMPDPISMDDTTSSSEQSESSDTSSPEPTETTTSADEPSTSEPASTTDAAPASLPAFETEPATQPVDMPAMSETTFAQPGLQKKSRKGLIIGSVIAVFLVLGLGGSVAAYNLWYQNPDKVLVDSVVNAIKAKTVKVAGTFTWQNDDMALTITPDTQANESAGVVNATVKFNSKAEDTKMLDGMTLKASVVYEKSGTVYFRLVDLKKVFEKAAEVIVDEQVKQYEKSGMAMTDEQKAEASQMMKSMYQPIVDKLDNQWIKAEADKETNSSDERKCFSEAYAKFSRDEFAKELGDVYSQHKFVVVKNKLGEKDGSIGYELDLDKKEAEAFGKAFEKTKIGKELAKCDEGSNTSNFDDEDDDFKSSSFKVWINKWSHELTHVSFEATLKDDSAGSFKGEFDTNFNKTVDVTVPKDAKTIDEIFEGFDPFGMNSAEALSTQVEV